MRLLNVAALRSSTCALVSIMVMITIDIGAIDALRHSGANITVVELTGTTHMRFMADKEREIVHAMKSFTKGNR